MARLGFGMGYSPEMNVREMAALAREAEKRGFEIAFFSETITVMRDAVTTLASFSNATNKIKMGATQIVRLRSPIVMAQTMASLDELSKGRMVFALGACTNSHAIQHSLPAADPPTSLREYYESIKKLLSEEEVTYHGSVVNLDGVSISFKPVRANLPIWLAATSRTGLRIAGQLADGVLLNATGSPEYSANALKILKKVAEEAGRSLGRFEVAQLVVTSLSKDRKEAMDAIRWEVASKFTPIQMPFNAIPRIRVGEPYIRKEDLPKFEQAYKKGGMTELMRALPESYLTGLNACGTPKEVEERIEEYAKAGVRLVIIRPATSKMAMNLLKTFAS